MALWDRFREIMLVWMLLGSAVKFLPEQSMCLALWEHKHSRGQVAAAEDRTDKRAKKHLVNLLNPIVVRERG